MVTDNKQLGHKTVQISSVSIEDGRFMYSLEQERGSSTRLSQSSLPLHQRSIGKQRVPWPSLLGQRNSEMSHVLTSDGAGNEADTVVITIHRIVISIACLVDTLPLICGSRKKKCTHQSNGQRRINDTDLCAARQQSAKNSASLSVESNRKRETKKKKLLEEIGKKRRHS